MSGTSLQSIYAVISHPAGADPTQYMFEKAIVQHQLDCQVLTFDVAPDNLGDAVRGIRAMGLAGFVCGEPHRRSVLEFLNRTTEAAGLAGMVNCVTRQGRELVGDTTEGQAFLDVLGRIINPAEKRIVLLGADRPAWPIAAALARAKPEHVTVVHPTEEAAMQLVGLLSGALRAKASAMSWQDDFAVPPDCQILVQATAIGREDADARVPLRIDTFRPDLVVADLVFNPPHTRFWRDATAAGCKAIDGLDVFVRQSALVLRGWTGVEPDSAMLRDAVEEYLLL